LIGSKQAELCGVVDTLDEELTALTLWGGLRLQEVPDFCTALTAGLEDSVADGVAGLFPLFPLVLGGMDGDPPK